jgi:hypothetical protein
MSKLESILNDAALRYLQSTLIARHNCLVDTVLDLTMGQPGFQQYASQVLRDSALFGPDCEVFIVSVQPTFSEEIPNYGTLLVTPKEVSYANLDRKAVDREIQGLFGDLVSVSIVELLGPDPGPESQEVSETHLEWRANRGARVSLVPPELQWTLDVRDRLVVVADLNKQLSPSQLVLLAGLWVDLHLASDKIRAERTVQGFQFAQFQDYLAQMYYDAQFLQEHQKDRAFSAQLDLHVRTAWHTYRLLAAMRLLQLLTKLGAAKVLAMEDAGRPRFAESTDLDMRSLIVEVNGKLLQEGSPLALEIVPTHLTIGPYDTSLSHRGEDRDLALKVRWDDDFYSFFVVTVLQNAKQYGIAHDGAIPVRVETAQVAGNLAIVFSNEADVSHTPRNPRMNARDGWFEFYPSAGGLSFLTTLIRRAGAGEVFWRTTPLDAQPGRMRFWLALNFTGASLDPEA